MRTKLGILILTVLFGPITGMAQVTKAPPPPGKVGQPKPKLPNLVFMSEYFPGGVNTLGISIANGGEADAGTFMVGIWVRKKGSATKAYFESRAAGVKVNGQAELIFKSLPPLVDVDIGIFIDSKKKIIESDESDNCAMVFADGSSGGWACKEIW